MVRLMKGRRSIGQSTFLGGRFDLVGKNIVALPGRTQDDLVMTVFVTQNGPAYGGRDVIRPPLTRAKK